MVVDALNDREVDLMSKADGLAEKLVQTLKCDFVVISLANTERLFSVGVAGMDTSDLNVRLHERSATVCGRTVEKNAAVVISDARTVEGVLDRLYVTNGTIVGYLGEPLRDENKNAIGAICAITRVPRIWSDEDREVIALIRDETEHMLAYAMLQNEVRSQSKVLEDYDNIIGAIAVHADAMISVHGLTGDLLFASNALLNEIDPQALETYMKANAEPNSMQEAPAIWGLDAGRNWRPKFRCHGKEVVFVQWDTPDLEPT